MKTLIHPTYFPNIEFFSHLLKSKNLIFEINDFYHLETEHQFMDQTEG